MKLLITGGHLTPALAVIDELQKTKKDVQILFVGRKYASLHSKVESFEYQEIKKRNIPFIHLTAGRVTRTFSLDTFMHMVKIPAGFLQAFRLLRRQRPDRVLSFGGYIALPVALMASMQRIPVFTHEQTIQPGSTNRLIAHFAQKVFLSFKDSKKYFKKENTEVSGNPVREQVKKVLKKPFDVDKTKKVVYVTGGSLGSHSINILIENVLAEILQEYILIHQTGNVKKYDDFQRLQEIREKLPKELKQHYFLAEHFSTEEVGYIYSVSDLVIGRSGANTFFELLALKKPAIFIPLPWSAHHEQQLHAELYKKDGLGEVFDQHKSSHELLSLISMMIGNLKMYQTNFDHTSLSYAENAAKTIIKTVVG